MTHIAVIGPGAIGSTFAAVLDSVPEHTVTLCSRRHLDRVHVEIGSEWRADFEGQIAVDAGLVEPSEWVLLAVKTYQTGGTADWLERLCGPGTTVVVLQNGVDHERRLDGLVGPARILPSILWTPAQAGPSGTVTVAGTPRLSLPDRGTSRDFAALFPADLATVEIERDFLTESWRKLTVNALGGLMAATGRPAGIFKLDDLQDVARRLADECVAVARAVGAALSSDDAAAIVEGYVAMDPDRGTSILHDRVAGRPLEWEARNAVVRDLGRRHGISTPISDVLVPLLAASSAADERTYP